jgi:pimeloyl-ACP methyl ester carboxylesterase
LQFSFYSFQFEIPTSLKARTRTTALRSGARLWASRFLCFVCICRCTLNFASADDVAKQTQSRPRRPVHLLAVLIGGIDSDPTPAQIDGTAARNEGNSGLYRFAGDITVERVIPEYFNWNGTRAGKIKTKDPPGSRGISEFVRQHLQSFPGDRVVIVGNSWGGHTALEVVQQLRDGEAPLAVNLVVFLDASSAGRGPARPKALPANVNRAVSYYTRSIVVWGKWDAGRRLENIDLADPANRFIVNGEPPYNAPFDIRGHVAAEWDEEIHSDIQRRLLALLPQPHNETK